MEQALKQPEAITPDPQSEIWLVDDDPFELELITKALESTNLPIRSFCTPESAISAALKNPPGLMLLDVAMPEISGLEVCRRLKNDPRIEDFPIIFISGHEALTDRVNGFQAGGVDYLIKPVQRQELLARVNTHLSLSRMQRGLESLVQERTLGLQQKSATLQQTNTKLEKTLTSLEAAQKQLLQSEKMAAIGELAAGVAHELNNPIGYVYSNLSMLEEYTADLFRLLDLYSQQAGFLNSEQQNAISQLRQEIDYDYLRDDLPTLIQESKEGASRARQIVADLKDFSRSDHGSWEETDLHAGLDRTLNIAHNELKYKAEVIKEYGGLPLVECLPSQINQVFLNLLVNAAHAIEENGVVTIRTGTTGGKVWVEIQDTGRGIAPESLDKIFTPFFTTKPQGIGTGLGLSISSSIIHRHHGRIDVESKLGVGTKFRIWLPRQQPAKVPDTAHP